MIKGFFDEHVIAWRTQRWVAGTSLSRWTPNSADGAYTRVFDSIESMFGASRGLA